MYHLSYGEDGNKRMIQEKWDEIRSIFERAFPSDNTLQVDNENGEMTVDKSDYILKVTINHKWIGYSFVLKKHVLGTEMSSWSDTDNYPLDYDSEVTELVHEDVRRFVSALLSGSVFIGKINNRAVIAVPVTDKKYALTYSPKFHFITKSELVTSSWVRENSHLFSLKT